MAHAVLTAQPGHVDMTGTGFMVYGERYRDAAIMWLRDTRDLAQFDPVPYQLLCQSLELHLKSFVWLVDRLSRKRIKDVYGHDLEKLWHYSKNKRIDRLICPTPLRDLVIALAGPYYKHRQFSYLDLDMIVSGFGNLKRERRILRRCRD